MAFLSRADRRQPPRGLLSSLRWPVLRRFAGELWLNPAADLAGYRLLVASLYSSPASVIPGGLVAVLTCILCWRASGLPELLALTLVTAFVAALRAVTIVTYIRRDHTHDTLADLARWDREFMVGATALSLCLGANCFIALTATANASAHLVAVAATVAFSSGYVARNAARPLFVTGQLLLFTVPMTVGLLASQDPYYAAIGYFCFMFVGSNVAMTLSVHRNLVALSQAKKRSEALAAALTLKNMTLDAALNNMSFGLAMFDADLRLSVSNSRFAELYGLGPEAVTSGAALASIEGGLTAAGVVSAKQAERIAAACREALAGADAEAFDLVTSHDRTFDLQVERVHGQGVLVLTEDSTDRRRAEATIERLARFDELTGLANRFELGRTMVEAFKEATSEAGFALHYIDLDNFKQVNDSLGHEAGDQVLVEAARRLRAATRPGDVVARFGGDEFVVVQMDGAAAIELAGRIVEGMAVPFDVLSREIHVTASIGIALAPDHGASPSEMLRHADLALYEAKAAGRSTFVIFAAEMGRAVTERQDLELLLRRAIDQNAFQLHYQPIVDLASGDVMSFEALMRWSQPGTGSVAPSIFIPLAEETGLISRLGDWAIERACLDAMTWPAPISVAVNVSPVQFRDPDRLIASVRAGLARSGLAPERLYLEVTESLLIENQESTLDAIHALRRIGVRFSLDDFGIGYSSLAYLSTYPFSQVKVDRSFAQSVTSNANAESIIQAVCGLSRRLGMNVVVEGIETVDQMEAVKRLGAERAQGYLFGRPNPVELARAPLARKVA
jgi:diguanylate cyclase (GGDEF)-like protein